MSVKALELATVEQAKILHEQFSLKEFNPEEKVKKVVGLYEQMDIKSISENLANVYINTAFSLLEKLRATKERKTELINIANSLIGREN
jgi:geranylgeranyl diphosphate synthase type II